MALNFQIPEKQKAKNLQTLEDGFGIPLKASLIPNVPNIPLGNFPEGITRFGTYYYDSLFIQAPSYETSTYNQQTGEFETVLNNIVFSPDSISTADGQVSGVLIKGAIVDVNGSNNLVRTQIAGLDGDVIEYINKGNYTVTIRGFFDEFLPDLAPFQRTNLLNYYCTAPVSLSIVNDFLNSIFKINKIAVDTYDIFQQQGIRNIQYFQINAISDNDFVIQEESK